MSHILAPGFPCSMHSALHRLLHPCTVHVSHWFIDQSHAAMAPDGEIKRGEWPTRSACPYMYIHQTLDHRCATYDLRQNLCGVHIRCIHRNRKRHDGVPNEYASPCDIVNTAASPARKPQARKIQRHLDQEGVRRTALKARGGKYLER